MEIKNTILVVDDEEFVKKSLTDVLVDEFEVIGAWNGKEALEILERNINKIAVIVKSMIIFL